MSWNWCEVVSCDRKEITTMRNDNKYTLGWSIFRMSDGDDELVVGVLWSTRAKAVIERCCSGGSNN